MHVVLHLYCTIHSRSREGENVAFLNSAEHEVSPSGKAKEIKIYTCTYIGFSNKYCTFSAAELKIYDTIRLCEEYRTLIFPYSFFKRKYIID